MGTVPLVTGCRPPIDDVLKTGVIDSADRLPGGEVEGREVAIPPVLSLDPGDMQGIGDRQGHAKKFDAADDGNRSSQPPAEGDSGQ